MKKLTIICLVLILTACAGAFNARMDDARDAFWTGRFSDGAISFASSRDVKSQDNLELLVSGNALFYAGDFDASDTAFEEFNRRDIELTSGSILREGTKLIAGNMSTEFRPYMMDALFVSYYQLLDAIATGRHSDGRVIINQSYARQQKMSREYKKMIAENQKSAEKNADLAGNIRTKNAQWAAYSDIMNPALMYLAGIYFINDGDANNARTYLGRANGMAPNVAAIATDLRSAENGTRPTNTTWVFIETGFAPKLIEERIDFPFISSRGITVVPIATSTPVFAGDFVQINGAELLADIDAMFMTEYNEYSVNDALRAFASTTARTLFQIAAGASDDKYSPLFGLGASIYSIATSNADVRSWATLPEYISVMRTDTPKSGLIDLYAGDKLMARANVPTSGNHIVYVRIIGGGPVVHVMNLKN